MARFCSNFGDFDTLAAPLLRRILGERSSFAHALLGDDKEIGKDLFLFVAANGLGVKALHGDDVIPCRQENSPDPHGVSTGRTDIAFREPDRLTLFGNQKQVVGAGGLVHPNQPVPRLELDGDQTVVPDVLVIPQLGSFDGALLSGEEKERFTGENLLADRQKRLDGFVGIDIDKVDDGLALTNPTPFRQLPGL